MKLNIILTITKIDGGALTGEELRDEVTSHIEGLEVDGWEVAAVSMVEAKESAPLAVHLVEKLRELCFQNPNSPSKINPTYTNEQMADYWMTELKRKR